MTDMPKPRPTPTLPQLLCIGIGAATGSYLGFGLLEGGAIGGGVMALCVFIGAIPYKRAMDAAK